VKGEGGKRFFFFIKFWYGKHFTDLDMWLVTKVPILPQKGKWIEGTEMKQVLVMIATAACDCRGHRHHPSF